jgi:DNA adenine methylase
MTNVLAQVRRLNALGNRPVAEPFAGGAGASLSLLFSEMTPEIFINDYDVSIRDFWWAVTNRSDQFIALLESSPIEMSEWLRQRDTYRSRGRVSRLKRGFATFYLNRCNRSGVVFNGGPIGGVNQLGKWKIDARFNKEDLITRCRKVAEYRDRITISGEDGVRFIQSLDANKTFFFIDPPYFEKGQSLYLNVADSNYHAVLAEQLRSMIDNAWLLTYDDCPEIRRLYRGWANIRSFSLRYSAAERRGGREVVITPKWIRLPDTQLSEAISW